MSSSKPPYEIKYIQIEVLEKLRMVPLEMNWGYDAALTLRGQLSFWVRPVRMGRRARAATVAADIFIIIQLRRMEEEEEGIIKGFTLSS